MNTFHMSVNSYSALNLTLLYAFCAVLKLREEIKMQARPRATVSSLKQRFAGKATTLACLLGPPAQADPAETDDKQSSLGADVIGV